MTAKCQHCDDTGELGGMGYLDCPHCNVAIDRTNLNNALSLLPPMIKEEVNWAAYKAGVQMAEAKWAMERANLIEHLRSMWGWAIELKHLPGYFDDDSEEGLQSVEDWQATVEAARKLLQTYDHKKG